MAATISLWNPEDTALWEATEKRIAYRNLLISIPALLLSFAVWMVWSVVVVNLPAIGFTFTSNELFWLTAIPGLSGATLRVFYSFMVPIFGGRTWTAISTGSLLIPLVGMGLAVQDTTTPYWIFALLALGAGLGGGNFASSMSNINFFFPKQKKGLALGLNAGLGNLGVSVVQFLVPIVIGSSLFGGLGGVSQEISKNGVTKEIWLQNSAFIWVPAIILVTVAAWLWMNNLETARASFREQSVIFRRRHTWIMSWLYIGTFGSFIGYSAAFPLLIKTLFPEVDPLDYAFLGPLVGAAVRPVGGWISDRAGGARVTIWSFLLMIVGVAAVLWFLAHRADPNAFAGFLSGFLLLFLATGIGNGSTFRMIPIIFRTERLRNIAEHGSEEKALRAAEKESAAVLGFTSAVGAFGAFLIPQAYNLSIEASGGAEVALYGFLLFYASCVVVAWWFYARRGASFPC